METHKTLVLSTGHLPFSEFDKLNTLSTEGFMSEYCFRVIDHTYGKIVKIGEVESGDITEKVFPSLWKIIQFCIEYNITYIDFDQDGPTENEFEIFNW